MVGRGLLLATKDKRYDLHPLVRGHAYGQMDEATRQATHAPDGSAALYAAAGEAVLGDIVLANERVKIVVASGGNTKTGQFVIVVA